MDGRIDRHTILDLMKHASLKELGKLATQKKRMLHPDRITTFIVDRNIN